MHNIESEALNESNGNKKLAKSRQQVRHWTLTDVVCSDHGRLRFPDSDLVTSSNTEHVRRARVEILHDHFLSCRSKNAIITHLELNQIMFAMFRNCQRHTKAA